MDRQQPLRGLLAGAQQVVQVGAAVAVLARRARAALQQRLVGRAPARLGEVDPPALGRVGHDRHPVAADPGRHRAVERVDARARRRAPGRRPRRSRAGGAAGPPAARRPPTRRPRTSGPCPRRACRRSRSRRRRARRPPARTRAAGPPRPRPGRSRRRAGPRARARRARPGSGPASGACARSSAPCTRGSTLNGVHSSNTSAMSEPSAAWTSIEVSGPMNFARAVEVGAERHALLLDREDRAGALAAARLGRAALDLVRDGAVAHREDLEAAGVGDDRAVPALEAVQAAELADQLVAGREEQVERVPEHHVVAEVGGLADLERLDDGLGGERDERRRADLAVGEPQRAGAGARARVAGADLQSTDKGRRA